jgi:hypothetical protein
MLKVKVKLSLCSTKHYAMKTYCGSGGIAPRILNLDTRWRWVVNFTPRALYPQGKDPGTTNWIRGWVGPRAVLDTVAKRKIPSPRQEWNPRTPIVQTVGKCMLVNRIKWSKKLNCCQNIDWFMHLLTITVLNFIIREKIQFYKNNINNNIWTS